MSGDELQETRFERYWGHPLVSGTEVQPEKSSIMGIAAGDIAAGRIVGLRPAGNPGANCDRCTNTTRRYCHTNSVA